MIGFPAMRILGIDPGTICLGWGVVEITANQSVHYVDHGSFAAPKSKSFMERLYLISRDISALIAEVQPQETAIEKIFLGKNVDSAFKLGHIRGVCATECQKVGSRIVEYSPREVKKSITGSGGADKDVLQRYLYAQLELSSVPTKTLDASDALALAYCHSLHLGTHLKMQRLEE